MKKIILALPILLLFGCGDNDNFKLKQSCILKKGNPLMNEDGKFLGCEYQENRFGLRFRKEEEKK